MRRFLAALTPGGMLGVALVAGLALVVLVATVWTPCDPLDIALDARFAGASVAHPLGADQFGRDILSRIMDGARISVSLALATVAIATAAGMALGTIAGFARGPVEAVLMAVNDALLAFPGILLALSLIAVIGSGATGIVVALTIAYLPAVVRVARAAALSIRGRDYVVASRLMGNSPLTTLWRHVVPNAWPQVAVLATSMFGWVLLAESALSFLGVGIPAPAPTWGNMLASARPYIATQGWLAIAPGLCIVAALLGVNLTADALRRHVDETAS